MKINKSLINQYNNPNTLLVVTSYPERGTKYSQNQDALAGFAKNRIKSLQAVNNDQKIVVISNYTHNPEAYIEDNVLVLRCFKTNKLTTFTDIVSVISRFDLTKNILIEFEFATFGKTITTSLFPFFLFTLKSQGKHTTIELHQVLDDLNKLRGHIGHKKNSFKTTVLNPGINAFYIAIAKLADNIIVLENELNNRLKAITKTNNIYTVAHGVDQNISKESRKISRKKLGLKDSDFVVILFGYVTWYKGADIAIKAFESDLLRGKKIKLLIAGGPSFNQKSQKHYQKFFTKIKNRIGKNLSIHYTGTLSEDEISVCFSASDLALFPYRVFMSSSGPLSLAFTHNIPFLLSAKMSPYLNSPDFNTAIKKYGLEKDDITFNLNPDLIAQKILDIRNKKSKLSKIKSVSKYMSKIRSYTNLAKDHQTIITNRNISVSSPNLWLNKQTLPKIV